MNNVSYHSITIILFNRSDVYNIDYKHHGDIQFQLNLNNVQLNILTAKLLNICYRKNTF